MCWRLFKSCCCPRRYPVAFVCKAMRASAAHIASVHMPPSSSGPSLPPSLPRPHEGAREGGPSWPPWHAAAGQAGPVMQTNKHYRTAVCSVAPHACMHDARGARGQPWCVGHTHARPLARALTRCIDSLERPCQQAPPATELDAGTTGPWVASDLLLLLLVRRAQPLKHAAYERGVRRRLLHRQRSLQRNLRRLQYEGVPVRAPTSRPNT